MRDRVQDANRLFPVRSAPGYYFYAGRLPRGRQALVGRSANGRIVVGIFSKGGDLTEVVRRELPSPPVLPGSDDIREVDEGDFHDYLHQEFGFAPETARVKEFRIEPEGLAVYQLPEHYQAFLRDPRDPIFDDEQRTVFPRLIKEWVEEGQFVLEWGNDYWLDSTSEVVAS